MSEHTKEPWKFIDVIGGCSVYAGRIKVLSYSYSPNAENKANARRIVACVNACAGFANPEKDIPAIETASKMHFDQAMANGQRASEYEAQRDELLAALKEVTECLDAQITGKGGFAVEEVLQDAIATIAKVK